MTPPAFQALQCASEQYEPWRRPATVKSDSPAVKSDSPDPLLLRVGYRYLPSTNGPTEHRGVVEATGRCPLKSGFLFSDRNRADFRFINGEFSWRYRNRLTAERTVSILSYHFTPYARGEVYFVRPVAWIWTTAGDTLDTRASSEALNWRSTSMRDAVLSASLVDVSACAPTCGVSFPALLATATSLAADGLPTFPNDERNNHQSRNRVCPLYVPDGVDRYPRQGDKREVSTERRLSGIRPQRGTACSS